jgi:hypothetical protein
MNGARVIRAIGKSRAIPTWSFEVKYSGLEWCIEICAAAKMAHLSDDETVAKMGHPVVVVAVQLMWF